MVLFIWARWPREKKKERVFISSVQTISTSVIGLGAVCKGMVLIFSLLEKSTRENSKKDLRKAMGSAFTPTVNHFKVSGARTVKWVLEK